MFIQSATSTYLFYLGHTDMRKGFDSLSGIVTEQMRLNPLNNNIYVFVNRRRTQMKLLQWEGDGFSLYYKRLEKGTFELQVAQNNSCYISISLQQLQMIFQGVSIKRNYRHKRYQHASNNC